MLDPLTLVIVAADASEVNKRKADRVLLQGQSLSDVLAVVLVEGDAVKRLTFRVDNDA